MMDKCKKILLGVIGVMDIFVAFHMDYKNMDGWDHAWLVSVVGYLWVLWRQKRK